MFAQYPSSAGRSNIVHRGEQDARHELNARAAYARPRLLAAQSWGAAFDGGARYRLLTPVQPYFDEQVIWRTMINADRAPEGRLVCAARLMILHQDSDTYSDATEDEPEKRRLTLGLALEQLQSGDSWFSPTVETLSEVDVEINAWAYRTNTSERARGWLFDLYGGSYGIDAPSALAPEHGRYDLWTRDDYLSASLVTAQLELAGTGLDPELPARARLIVSQGAVDYAPDDLLFCLGASLYWIGDL